MNSIKKKPNKDNKEEQTEAEQHGKKDPPNANKQSPKISSTEMGMMNAKEREEYNEIIGAEDLFRMTDICDNDVMSMNKIATTAETLATADLSSEWGKENEDEECRIQLGITYPETKEHIAEMMNILRGMGIKNIGYHEPDKLEHLIATGRAKLNILLKIIEEYRTKILKNLEKCRTMKTMALRESKDLDESIEDPSISDAWDYYDLKRTSQSTPGSGNFDQQRRRHNVIPEPSHHSQNRRQLISEIKDDINQTLTAQMEKMQNLFITELGKLNEKIIQNQESNIEAHEHTNKTIKQLKRQKTEERKQKTQVDVDRMYAEQEHVSQAHFKQDYSKQTNVEKGSKKSPIGKTNLSNKPWEGNLRQPCEQPQYGEDETRSNQQTSRSGDQKKVIINKNTNSDSIDTQKRNMENKKKQQDPGRDKSNPKPKNERDNANKMDPDTDEENSLSSGDSETENNNAKNRKY